MVGTSIFIYIGEKILKMEIIKIKAKDWYKEMPSMTEQGFILVQDNEDNLYWVKNAKQRNE